MSARRSIVTADADLTIKGRSLVVNLPPTIAEAVEELDPQDILDAINTGLTAAVEFQAWRREVAHGRPARRVRS